MTKPGSGQKRNEKLTKNGARFFHTRAGCSRSGRRITRRAIPVRTRRFSSTISATTPRCSVPAGQRCAKPILFLTFLDVKMIFLARQARDKRWTKLTKDRLCIQGPAAASVDGCYKWCEKDPSVRKRSLFSSSFQQNVSTKIMHNFTQTGLGRQTSWSTPSRGISSKNDHFLQCKFFSLAPAPHPWCIRYTACTARPDPDSKYTTYQMTPDVTGKPCDTSAGGMSGPLSPASLYLLR